MRDIPIGHASDNRSGRLPTKEEKVTCPEPSWQKRGEYTPAKVYESKNADGKPILRGILSPHKHWARKEDCPWSGHVVDVIRVPKKSQPSGTSPKSKPGAGD